MSDTIETERLGDQERQQSSQRRDPPKLGKPSAIIKYCKEAIDKHREHFEKNGDAIAERGGPLHLWICFKKRRGLIARDEVCEVCQGNQILDIEGNQILDIQHLRRKYCSWFKRYFSLYSVTAVRDVQVG
jgi:hypothetical protein